MDLFPSAIVREADRVAMEELGIPGVVLMENAANRVLEIILKDISPERVTILTGPGNNGGDGHALARLLATKKIDTTTISTVPGDKLSPDARTNFNISGKCDLSVVFSVDLENHQISDILNSSDLIVDALLGTGSRGNPRGEIARLIQLVTSCGVPVLSIDIPSGIDPDTGEVFSPCIRADITVSMLVAKTGLLVIPAAENVGKLHVVDIGVPVKKIFHSNPRAFSIDREFCSTRLPARAMSIHKGQRGCVLIAGGSGNYRGATVLAAMGALRAGSGLVLSLGDREVEMALGSVLPEAISLPFPESTDLSYGENLIQEALKWSSKAGCCLIGPGFGRSEEKTEALSLFWRTWKGPVLVDADGLHALSLMDRSFIQGRPDSVITPHEGEAARLLKVPVETVSNNRLATARELASRWGVCVLKGPLSIIDDGESTAIVEEGNPCLSVPGSGDILSGIISCFLAGGCDIFDA
ncbi:MAG: NAD(P)H-hydrate epimerase, partial [Synergistales bacterium]|nr:NAD(P)H-hydrate epimerase [Synergistales bacterium]